MAALSARFTEISDPNPNRVTMSRPSHEGLNHSSRPQAKASAANPATGAQPKLLSASEHDGYTKFRNCTTEAAMDAQAQAEIDRLKSEVAELRKALGNKQQLSPPNLPSLRDNFEFVTDMARFSEGIATESAVRKKHHFDEATWERLASDEQLIERIEAEKLRRIRDGSFKREKAQAHVVAAPDVLNGIMTDPKQSAKHRIDSAKVLDALADPGPQRNTANEDRVHIVIDLGADQRLTFDKPIRPGPDDDKIVDVPPTSVPGFDL